MPVLNILMATHNGAPFLDDQLASFQAQSHEDWQLWVSDDGSTDATLDIVQAFAAAHPGRVKGIISGPRQGSGPNFLSLLAQPDLAGQWVCFADQDDVWLPHKLDRAVTQLMAAPNPLSVYASRTFHTRADLTVTGMSRSFTRPFGFGNALVQNVLAGNTIVMPPVATDMVRHSVPATQTHHVPFHDWWIYQWASGCGADIVFDPEPGLYYRQHTQNAMGASMSQRFTRFRQLWSGEFAQWIGQNLAALEANRSQMVPEAQEMLSAVQDWRAASCVTRAAPHRVGLRRHSTAGNIILHLLARTGRL